MSYAENDHGISVIKNVFHSCILASDGTEGRRLLTQKFSHDNFYDLTTLKLWEMMEIAFIRPRNITFDRYVIFSKKQKKGKTVEHFYSILKELAENCDFESREEVIIRDIFITNMLDDDIQRELLRDTVDPERALRIAVNMEMGHQNQQRISSNNNNSAAGSTINAIQSFNIFCGAGARGNHSGRVAGNRAAMGQCRRCGQVWTPTHRQVCPALGKKCNHCGLLNHFATVCRKKLNNTRNSCQDNRITNLEIAETTEQKTHSENQKVNYTNYNEQFNSDYDSLGNNYLATVENISTPPIALQNMTITIVNTDCHLHLDSGSGCTIINISLAREIMLNCAQSQRSEKKPLELKSFSNDIVETLGTLKTLVCCNDWKFQKAKITVVADGFQPILGRDLFDQLGITISQKPCPNIRKSKIKRYENRRSIQSIQNFTETIVSRIKKGEKYQFLCSQK